MSTIVVSAGYDIPEARRASYHGKPRLRRQDRDRLRAEVRNILASFGGVVVFEGEGKGVYQGEPELACTWVAWVPPGNLEYLWFPNLRALTLRRLREQLGQLARRYHQDSIALTIANRTEFCGEDIAD